jgi:hypothetical protein
MNEQKPEWLWKFPKLPQVPDNLVEMAYKSIKEWRHDPGNIHYKANDEEKFVKNGQTKNSVAFIQFMLEQPVLDWIYENIIDHSYGNLRITQSTTDPNGGEKHKIAHTDFTRDFVLIYLLESGGPDHRTVFYHEEGQSIVRERHTRVFDYENLKEIGSIKVPLRRWILMQTQILHAVENIPNHRVAFQLGVNDISAIKSPFEEWDDQ